MSTTTQTAVALGLAVAGVVIAAGCVAITLWLRQGFEERIEILEEDIMAEFDVLKQDITDLKAAVGDAAARVEAALGTLQDDSADQAAVDAAHSDLRGVLDSLNAIAQAPAPEPAPAEEPAAPAEPTF